MAHTTRKNNSNNESGANFADISNRDSVQAIGASTSIAPDSGDGITTDDTISNEINKESSHMESSLDKTATGTDNTNKSKSTEKDDDVLEDSKELELQWDEDDGNDTLENDTHRIDDLEKKLLEETEENNQHSLNELETGLILEDKLLKEPINSEKNSENQNQKATKVTVELNEDELLQDGQHEDTEAMDVARSDEDSVTEKNSSKNILDVGNVTQEENAVTDMKDSSRSNNDSNSSDNDHDQLNDLSIEVDVALEDSRLHVKVNCGFSKPDVMLEIPTQEIDINDLPDSPIDEGIDSMEETHNTSKEVTASSVEMLEPCTSSAFPKMTPDTANEPQEVTDCLGLLAESSRVMGEDEEQDDDDGDADDDDDDFDQDESSNQMTAEHSEDSNAQHSETEPTRGDTEHEEEDFASDEVDIDEDGVNGQLRRKLKNELEVNEDEDRMPVHRSTKIRKEKDHTSKPQDEIKKEKEDNTVSTCATKETDDISKPKDNIKKEKENNTELTHVTKEKYCTSISQVNVEKDKEDNVISAYVTEDKESESQEREDSIISKEKDNTSTSKNDVTKEDEKTITSTVATKKKDSTAAQDTLNKEREGTIPSIGVTESSEEDTIKPKEDAVPHENTVNSVNKEKESGFRVTIKTEKEESRKRKRPIEKEVVRKYIDTKINDDVIEQVMEIETVKISDDEDDEPSKKIQEKLQQTTDETTPLEEPLQGKTVVEKNMKVDEVTALEMTTAIEKSTETTAVSETPGIPEKALVVEKPAESDDATITLTSDETHAEESHTADGSTTSLKSSRMKNFTVSTLPNTSIISVVELEESSSEDDIQEVSKETPPEHSVSHLQKLLDSSFKPPPLTSMTTVNIPTGIDIMSTSSASGNKTQIVTKEGEVVISGVPKPPPHKTARLNTSEVTIKTTSSSEQTLVIPEAKAQEQSTEPTKPKLSLEIFSLDSDEEEAPAKEPEKSKKKMKKCVNSACSSGSTALQAADIATAEYYDAARKKKPFVCQPCADAVLVRKQKLMAGIKNMTPLLKLDTSNSSQDLVEISDSESESEDPEPQEQQPKETIGEEAAKFLEEHLADVLNETWKKYKLDDRLKETQNEINAEIMKLEDESKEINQMLEDCQRVTDKLRSELYATFEHGKVELPPLLIYETPEFTYMGPETENAIPATIINESRLGTKRKLATPNEIPAKRPAIPLGYTPLENSKRKVQETKADDDKDISVVKLSAESAPADLPPPGDLSRPPLRVGMAVYAMKNAFGPWFKSRVMEITPKNSTAIPFTMCRIKFDHKLKNNGKILPARCIAYAEPAEVRMTIGTRLIALFKDANKRESYYSGVVAEIPNPVNNYRYLVFFDDGYAQYVSHAHTRLVCECSNLVWEEVHPLSREFVREYLMAYPERPMVRLHEGQHLKTEWDGKWWSSRVARVDASLAQVVFLGDGRREWVYRGSTRLAPLYLELRAAERHRPRPVPRSTQPRSNLLPYVEYTRSVEQPTSKAQETQPVPVALTTQQQTEEIRRQRAVAKKSTTSSSLSAAPIGPTTFGSALSGSAPGATPAALDSDNSRVVYYTPKNAVRPYKLVPHTCSPACKRSDVLSLKELRTYNPLAKPLLSGWERQIVRYKGQREVMYRAPCGRRLRTMAELHRYLRATHSELPVDLFDFYHATHCLAEFVLHKCLVGKKDLSHGKENVPVPCVNCYDESLPEFCSYNTERTPTSGVPLNLDPDFLCGCDCTDDCEDKTKCACWKLTLEGARTIGLDGINVGYEYKRLPEPLPSGIYECNSKCKCKQTCLNRVAQHPLQLKLQVFKTLNRGWGIRALNDVPKGAFLCVYAGNLLTDATANLDGLNEGDEYLAELDYIEVVEQMKEGYEEDIPDADKKLDKKETTKAEDSEEEPPSSSEDDENASKTDKEDDDFRPGCVTLGVSHFSKSLRKRSKIKTEMKEEKEKEIKGDPEEDCITISDDDEVREPSRFTANPGMAGNDFVSKYRSVRTLFGEDEACYIMDAKVQGNIGRYLNHSCSPNVFVQNVFVDTHDPRFPWVAFFALSHVRAGTELTWNYNYDVGSVPGKVLYCYCEAPNCRGRLL